MEVANAEDGVVMLELGAVGIEELGDESAGGFASAEPVGSLHSNPGNLKRAKFDAKELG